MSYFGINDKAIESSLKSQLSSASRSLKAFQVEYDNYPTTIDCSIANSSTNLCLKPGDNATYTYQVDNTVGSQTFTLYATSTLNGKIFKITDGSAAEEVGGIDISWSQVAAFTGGSTTCGLTSDGQAYCWDSNSYGQLGNNSTTNSLVPVAVDTSGVLNGKTSKAIAGGYASTCTIASNDNVYCWGYNGSSAGVLGNNSTVDSSIPVAVYTAGVLSGKTIKSVTTGSNYACVIASDNQAYCWGSNSSGQIGNNSTTSSIIPVAVYNSGVLSGKSLISISAGSSHTCAVSSEGLAYCWGVNNTGCLGNNSTTNSSIPVAVDTSGVLSGKTLVSISAGNGFSCALTSDGKIYCWGRGDFGQLGNNGTTNSSIPVAVDTSGVLSGKTLVSVSAGNGYACTVSSDGQVFCWGYNSYGRLGNNSTTNSSIPVAVDTSGALSGKAVKSVTAGSGHTCVVASDNQIYCWGWNNSGQLGNNSTTNSYVPVKVLYSN